VGAHLLRCQGGVPEARELECLDGDEHGGLGPLQAVRGARPAGAGGGGPTRTTLTLQPGKQDEALR